MPFHTRRISSYILGRLAPALSVPHSVTYVLPALPSSCPPFYVPIPSPPPPNSSVTAYFVVLFIVRFLSIRHPARVPTFLAHVPRLSEHQTNPSPTLCSVLQTRARLEHFHVGISPYESYDKEYMYVIEDFRRSNLKAFTWFDFSLSWFDSADGYLKL